ncbi:S-layer homology domain-containing protein [Paenibacillus sp. SI8]|uniref:S-layer homology domain-containing protein n=1 Tax=unclassified Paenibacillus TaxID=185978 RepID=UPI00346618A4
MNFFTFVRIIQFFVFLTLLVSSSGTSYAKQKISFRDLSSSHWAYPTIEWAVSNGITVGFDDATFRPDETITEEQFIALLVRSFGDIPDRDKSDTWSDKYYLFLNKKNYPLSNVRNAAITRRAMAEIVAATQSVNYSSKYAIKYLLDRGLVNGKTSSTIEGFKGSDYLTRAEALQCIKNLLETLTVRTLGDRPQTTSDIKSLNIPLLPVERLQSIGNAEQVIMVTADDYDQVSVKIETFEKESGVWNEKFPSKMGVIGVKGFTSDMHEGAKKSPEGVFTLSEAFGKYENPGTKLDYRQTDTNDYWIDDPDSFLYNTWQVGLANGRWKSAESLLRKDSLYDYAVEINYNTERIPGKGSAIFLHVWGSEGKGTAGCTAMSKSDLLEVMKWLDPAKKPVIVQGVEKDVNNM